MSHRNYFIKALVFSLIISPLVVSVTMVFLSIGMLGLMISIPAAILALIGIWVWLTVKSELPPTTFERILPVLFACGYYLIVWLVFYGITGYQSGSLGLPFYFLTIPYILVTLTFGFGGMQNLFPLLIVFVYLIIVGTVLVSCRIKQGKPQRDGRIYAGVLVMAFLLVLVGYQFYDRSTTVLDSDTAVECISDEVDLTDYHPFLEGNLLTVFPGTPSLKIESNYPKLDGSTATYPVYGAITQALYMGLDDETVQNYVECSKTDAAYERLIVGEIDVFFGTQPSEQQIELAKESEVEFTLTPIAREAFVFFVNADNPVESLTLDEIRSIYLKKTTNWSAVGGNDEEILAFQRPENSGSQTIMLAEVMEGATLPAPLKEEYAEGMGGMIKDVATYRNYSSAIGYSFRYYITGMKPNENIELLAIDGIEPTVENIRNGSYPFTVDIYAVTTGNESENTRKLIEWTRSEEGQAFIEKCGYARADI